MGRGLCLFLAALLTATPLFAQDQLSLPQAVQEALAHNRSLEAARAGTREADARIAQARSAFFPRVSVVESWQRGDQPVFVFSSLLSSRRFTSANFAIDSLNSPDATGFFHGAVLFEQIVFDGGRTGAAVDTSRLQSDVARFTADDESARVIVEVTEAYGRVITADAGRRAADAAVAAAEGDATRATRRRDAGTLSDADVLSVAMHLADARQRRVQADGDERAAKAELNRLLGFPIEREYEIQEPAVTAARETSSLEALLAEADAARPDLKRASAAERIAEAARRQSRSSWYPQAAVQGAVEANGTRIGDRASSWLVGGELRWTLSLGGAEAAQRRAANESAVRARIERDDARARAHVEIAGTMARLNAALARRDLAQAAADYAREAERVVRDRFDAGLATTTDLLRAAAATSDTNAQRTAALVDIIVNRATLDRALGRIQGAASRTLP